MNEKEEYRFKIEGDAKEPDFAKIRKLMKQIMRLGYDSKTAAHFAQLITANPIVDAEGNTIVLEDNNILAKLKVSYE